MSLRARDVAKLVSDGVNGDEHETAYTAGAESHGGTPTTEQWCE